MRASRLLSVLLELQHRPGGATAQQLADACEVSVRTIYRDVSALQAAGVPLWTETGPGGGIRLVEGWRTDLDGLTADEAMALFLSGAPGAADALGLGTVLLAAETKVLTTLPSDLRHQAARMRERFHLDAPGWFQRPDSLDHLAAVADAVWAARRLDRRYRRADGAVERRVDPLGLVLKAGTWYLVARHRSDVRTYRVGRIERVTARDETFSRPDGFDLAAWWAASSAEFDASLLRYPCRLRLSPPALRALVHVVGPEAGRRAQQSAGEPDAEGWCEVDLLAESEEVAAGQLVALGAGVEVLEPASLRARLHRTATEMAERNAPPDIAANRAPSATK